MSAHNILYAQSGGVTAVINASACGVIETARALKLGKVFAAKNGILGVLNEELIDTSLESDTDIAALKYTPGGAFGSCRFKLKSIEENRAQYEKLVEVFAAHDIGYFFYNGGGDSQDTAYKVSQISAALGHPITCIGIPKTIDNDLALTDNCPGFGSVAKYVAISMREAGYDIASMAASSTKVFIMEVMGRHAGWIAAASGLAHEGPLDAPHIILFPERKLDQTALLAKVQHTVDTLGFCTITVSEGVKNKAGQFLSDLGGTDAFGHKQLGGVAPLLAQLIKDQLGYKYHWAVLDYLQRSARHIASAVDVEQAYALGKAAVELSQQGQHAVMPIIIRESDTPYRYSIGSAPLKDVANHEKLMPDNFITPDGFHITDACRRYMAPLIQGEAYPPYELGLPRYVRLKNQLVAKKLETLAAMRG
ncbi:MAG TPA: 6-phosphofructokinase [Gammaproteobacteria bacterium]|nr:6-phosphofructokinase [Gammaproteobacteria bacterium]